MILYDCKSAPSPRRARMFIAEKGLEIEKYQVDLAGGEQFTPEFMKINPRCTVPVLELDDGTRFTDNASIARYLEDAYPEPPLMGTSLIDKAVVAEWNARVEFDGLLAIMEAFRNRAKGLKGHALTGPRAVAQIPLLAERGVMRTQDFFVALDARLQRSPFVGGERFSLADISATVAVDFAKWVKVEMGEEQVALRRWHDAMSQRPSYSA